MGDNGAGRRFERCARVHLRTPAGELLATTVATTPRARLLGLTRLEPRRIEPLLIPRCDSVHGFWMRADIDVCFLAMPAAGAMDARVLAVQTLRRRRALALSRAIRRDTPRARIAALELPSGTARRLGIAAGDTIAIGHARAPRT